MTPVSLARCLWSPVDPNGACSLSKNNANGSKTGNLLSACYRSEGQQGGMKKKTTIWLTSREMTKATDGTQTWQTQSVGDKCENGQIPVLLIWVCWESESEGESWELAPNWPDNAPVGTRPFIFASSSHRMKVGFLPQEWEYLNIPNTLMHPGAEQLAY